MTFMVGVEVTKMPPAILVSGLTLGEESLRLIESKLLESPGNLANSFSGASSSVGSLTSASFGDSMAAAASFGMPRLPGGPEFGSNNLDLDLLNDFGVLNLDFEASDAIFEDEEEDNDDDVDEPSTSSSSSSEAQPQLETGTIAKTPSVTIPSGGGDGDQGQKGEDSCDCNPCKDRKDIEAEQREEVARLRADWAKLRKDMTAVYRMVMDGSWSDSNKSESKPDLNAMTGVVKKLCWRDPHQLFLKLEGVVRLVVTEVKNKLIELLHKQAKETSLPKDFIHGTRKL